jgi:5-oxoprolinase (ATP-hydrolysing) subunit A
LTFFETVNQGGGSMKCVDINCDMGESFGVYTIGMDAEVIRHITSANIACGFHAGDPMVLDQTVGLAAVNGVGVGAHPGYPDLMGFGRRTMACSAEEIRNYIIYQVGAVRGFCDAHGVALQHVKPHGSLYNMAVEDDSLTRTIAAAVAAVDPDLLLVALAGQTAPRVREIAFASRLQVLFEAFPDRAYTAQGSLVSRRKPGAVIKDPHTVAQRALMMAAEGRVVSEDGTVLELAVDTLCVHGDNPAAVDLVRTIRQTLEANGVAVMPMAEIVRRRSA